SWSVLRQSNPLGNLAAGPKGRVQQSFQRESCSTAANWNLQIDHVLTEGDLIELPSAGFPYSHHAQTLFKKFVGSEYPLDGPGAGVQAGCFSSVLHGDCAF